MPTFLFSELRRTREVLDLQLEREIVWNERRKTYATGRTIEPYEDIYCGPFISDGADKRTSIGKDHTCSLE